LPARGI